MNGVERDLTLPLMMTLTMSGKRCSGRDRMSNNASEENAFAAESGSLCRYG